MTSVLEEDEGEWGGDRSRDLGRMREIEPCRCVGEGHSWQRAQSLPSEAGVAKWIDGRGQGTSALLASLVAVTMFLLTWTRRVFPGL